MGKLGRFVQKQVLHDDAFHGLKGRDHMLGIGVRLRDVLALYIEATEAAVERRLEHVWNAQARFGIEMHAPRRFEQHARWPVGDVAITWEFVRERTHIAGALHIVLPT